MMGNFYQFLPVVSRSLWNKLVTSNENHNKEIWDHFTFIIRLKEQIWQHNNKSFQTILTRAKKGVLNNNDVAIFNNKVASTLPIHKPDKNVVIVQQNIIRHTIHQLQIRQFAKANNCNVIFFPVQHSWTKNIVSKL